jgi:hypothetical protein
MGHGGGSSDGVTPCVRARGCVSCVERRRVEEPLCARRDRLATSSTWSAAVNEAVASAPWVVVRSSSRESGVCEVRAPQLPLQSLPRTPPACVPSRPTHPPTPHPHRLTTVQPCRVQVCRRRRHFVSLLVTVEGPQCDSKRLYGFFSDSRKRPWSQCLPDSNAPEAPVALECGTYCGYRVRLASHLHHYKYKLLSAASGYLRTRLHLAGGGGAGGRAAAPVAPPAPSELLRVTSDSTWNSFVDLWQRQVRGA